MWSLNTFVLSSYCVSEIFSNIKAALFSPISSRSTYPSKTILGSLVSLKVPWFFLDSVCIRGVLYVRLKLFIRTELIAPSIYSLILSDTNSYGVFILTSDRGLYFPLWVPFLLHKTTPLSINTSQKIYTPIPCFTIVFIWYDKALGYLPCTWKRFFLLNIIIYLTFLYLGIYLFHKILHNRFGYPACFGNSFHNVCVDILPQLVVCESSPYLHYFT